MDSTSQTAIHPNVIIAGALAFVAGNAWNDAFQALIKEYNPIVDRKTVVAQFVYAIFVTLLILLIGYFIFEINKVSSAELSKYYPPGL